MTQTYVPVYYTLVALAFNREGMETEGGERDVEVACLCTQISKIAIYTSD